MKFFTEIKNDAIDRLETSIAELTQLVGIMPTINIISTSECEYVDIKSECAKFGIPCKVHQVTDSTILDIIEELSQNLNNKMILDVQECVGSLLDKVHVLQDICGLKVTLDDLTKMKEPNDFIAHPTYCPSSKSILLLNMLMLNMFHEEPSILGKEVTVVGTSTLDGVATLTMYNSLGATVHSANTSSSNLTKNLLLSQSDIVVGYDVTPMCSDARVSINLTDDDITKLNILFKLYNAMATQMTHEVMSFNNK